MAGILETNFHILKHLSESRGYIYDISLIDSVLNDYDTESSVYLLNMFTKKYKSIINEVGTLLTNIIVITKEGVYETKSAQDLIFDLEYLRDCIIVKASVGCGLANNVQSVLNKIVEEENKKTKKK